MSAPRTAPPRASRQAPRLAAATLAVALALLGVACGEDDASDGATTAAAPASGTAIPPELAAALRENLEQVHGLSASEASCALDYISDEAGAELAEAGRTGEVGERLLDVAADAGVACAGGG